jgi:hypothetical protein
MSKRSSFSTPRGHNVHEDQADRPREDDPDLRKPDDDDDGPEHPSETGVSSRPTSDPGPEEPPAPALG